MEKCNVQPLADILWYELSTPVHLQHEADSALKKARLLQAQRQEEYEKAKVSTSRLEEEQNGGGGGAAAVKQLEKRRRLEEEALQKVQAVLFLVLVVLLFVDCYGWLNWSVSDFKKSPGILKVHFSEVCLPVVVVPASHICILCSQTISFEYTCIMQTTVLLAYYTVSVFHH